jgi:hypothetical protein
MEGNMHEASLQYIQTLSRSDLVTILRAQLALLRLRAERGITITCDALGRAESLARTLERGT